MVCRMKPPMQKNHKQVKIILSQQITVILTLALIMRCVVAIKYNITLKYMGYEQLYNIIHLPKHLHG